MNKKVFGTEGAGVAVADDVNHAGGKAYKYDSETAAAVFCMTAMFPEGAHDHHLDGAEQLKQFQNILNECDPKYVAKLAVYARYHGKMKDAPLLATMMLVAHKALITMEEAITTDAVGIIDGYFEDVFPIVADTPAQFRNAAQIVRSGVLGRRSFGSRLKRIFTQRLFDFGIDYLVRRGLTGQKPSLADVIAMIHPDPGTQGDNAAAWRALFGYVRGVDPRQRAGDRMTYHEADLPPLLKEYEAFKKDPANVPIPEGIEILQIMGMLPKGATARWAELARRMSWTQLFKNMATLARQGAFEDEGTVEYVAEQLRDGDKVRLSRQFPYALFVALLTIDPPKDFYGHRAEPTAEVPFKVKEALTDALDESLRNIPAIPGQLVVGIDTSGSMHSPLNERTVARYIDVSALFGAAALRANPESWILPFDTQVNQMRLSHRDSVASIAEKLSKSGGVGTNISDVFRVTLERVKKDEKFRPDAIILISDMQTWMEGTGIYEEYGWGNRHGTVANEMFAEIKKRCGGKTKLVCWNVAAGQTTQAVGANVLNLGGFSEALWKAVSAFLKGGEVAGKAQAAGDVDTWLKEIKAVPLDAEGLAAWVQAQRDEQRRK